MKFLSYFLLLSFKDSCAFFLIVLAHINFALYAGELPPEALARTCEDATVDARQQEIGNKDGVTQLTRKAALVAQEKARQARAETLSKLLVRRIGFVESICLKRWNEEERNRFKGHARFLGCQKVEGVKRPFDEKEFARECLVNAEVRIGDFLLHRYAFACAYLELAEEQDYDLEIKARAGALLGKVYFEGKGVAPDNEKAYGYALKASQQNYSMPAKALGWVILGAVAYTRGEDGLQEAADNFFKAAEQNYDVMAQAWAWVWLGNMYFCIDSAKSREYYKKASEQQVNNEAKADAEMNLGIWEDQFLEQAAFNAKYPQNCIIL